MGRDSPNLLIIGASIYQHHIYHTARRLGFTVYAIDQNPKAQMLSVADDYRIIDIYDIKKAVKYAKELDVDAVATVNLDQGMKAVNQIQSKLGLPHKTEENVIHATRKDLMRKTWSEAGLTNPSYQVFDKDHSSAALDYVKKTHKQLIVKPVDNAAKRGISRIKVYDNKVKGKLTTAFDASDLGRIIVEEFIEGELFFAPTYVHDNGKVTTSIITQQITDELVQVRYDGPARIDPNAKESIKATAKSAAKCFGPGPYHTEIIYSPERGAVLVETSPRISYATVAITRIVDGFDPVSTLLSDCTPGMEIGPVDHPTADHATLRHLEPPPGCEYHLPPAEEIRQDAHVYEVVPLIKTGEIVSKFETNDDRVFYFVIYGNNPHDVDCKLSRIETKLLETCFGMDNSDLR